MNRFLPLLILLGLLFGQDILHLKSDETYKGTFIGKVDKATVFKVEGEKSTKKFSINDVTTIEASKCELNHDYYYVPQLLWYVK